MVNKKELRKFLKKAKKATYASGDASKKIVNDDKSTTLVFEDKNWKYHDNYFGGEPFGGREVVFFKNKPVYIMTYYGWVGKTVANVCEIYDMLTNALKLIPENNPYRGPEKYDQDELSYSNNFTGKIDNFFGEEIIKKNNKKIYKAKYIGGLVDQRQ